VLDALVLTDQARAGDRPVLGGLASSLRVTSVDLFGEFPKALQCLGSEAAGASVSRV
jgi:hypothetical protein